MYLNRFGAHSKQICTIQKEGECKDNSKGSWPAVVDCSPRHATPSGDRDKRSTAAHP